MSSDFSYFICPCNCNRFYAAVNRDGLVCIECSDCHRRRIIEEGVQ